MIYVVSDLHGYPFERFTEALNRAGFSEKDRLYVIGDAVDRGRDGIKYLRWLMTCGNAELILGNHEDMMRKCDFLFAPDALERMKNLNNEQRVNLGIWMSNGAENTVASLFSHTDEERGEILGYLSALPAYKELAVGEKRFLLVHSGLRDFSPMKELSDYSLRDLIWNRPDISDRYYEDITTVFGHTPTFFFGEEYRGKPIFTDTWINIDVGAGYRCDPVILRLDDMELFTV